jgi:hypothetical protein
MELHWPFHKRSWVWLLGHGGFSKPFFIIPCFVLYYIFGPSRQIPLGFAGVGLALAITWVAVIIGGHISVRETRSVQRERDRRAAEILEAVLRGCPCQYYLYLRSFFLTGQLQLMNQTRGNSQLMPSFFSEAEMTDLETMLERAVRKSGPLIALGQPGEMIGAGRLPVPEEEWMARFTELARRATCIFVVPYPSTGTFWEVGWLRDNGYFAKCVFVMPPIVIPVEKFEWRKRKVVRVTVFDMKILWEKAASVWAENDLHLPAYSSAGLLFTLNDTGILRAKADIGNTARLRTNMAKLDAMR